MQDEKLFQDTTVESKNPKQNNAFGGTAFIGSTDAYGEQWLYSRPDISKIKDLFNKSIKKAVLYIPTLNQSGTLLTMVGLKTRFCSFGSNWNNKKMGYVNVSSSESVPGYHRIDITNIITNSYRIQPGTEGWIIKSGSKDNGFSVISTGDSFYAPQILEITFK